MIKKYLFLSIFAAFLAVSFSANALNQKPKPANNTDLVDALESILDVRLSLSRLPGNTIAQYDAKRGIVKELNYILPSISSCNQRIVERHVINTKVLGDVKRALQSAQWSEEWTIRACNKIYKFTIVLSLNGSGGHNFEILY